MHNRGLNLRLCGSLLATAIVMTAILFTTVSCRSRTAPTPESTTPETALNLSISVSEGTVRIGETVAVEILLHNITTSLSGYDIEVSLRNEKIARIVNVIVPDFGLKEVGNLPNSSVRIKAVDLNDIVSSGARKALLATLEFEGINPGTTDITVFVRAMDDDDGNPIEPDISYGHIEVLSSKTTSESIDTPESVPTRETTVSPTPVLPSPEDFTLSMGGEITVPVGDATAVELTLYNIDKGLSGYDLIVSVDNEELSQIVSVVLPDFGITEVGNLPNSSVRIRVIDLNDTIPLGTAEALLATLELEGIKSGTSAIIVSIHAMDDDVGNPVEPRILPGSIEVVPLAHMSPTSIPSPASAPDITVSPTSQDFGQVMIGTSGNPRIITITNDGNADLNIGTIDISGTDTNQFSIQNDNASGQTLAPSANATLRVFFSPTLSGSKLATLTIPSNDPDENPINVSLSGTGNAHLMPIIYVDVSNTVGPWDGTSANPYQSIQDGIDAAVEGDTVQVATGTYYENITMKSGVALLGAGAEVTTIDAQGYGDVVDARANYATISGFTLKNSGMSDRGVYINGPWAPSVNNNVIVGNNIGIGVWYGANPDIRNNIIESNFDGLYVFGSDDKPSNPSIVNNTIVNNERAGIVLRETVSPTILNNIIAGHVNGWWAEDVHYEDSWGINYNYVTGSPTLSHNNLWNNDVNYERNNTADNTLAGIGDISEDPLFVDLAGSDYHLQPASPCIDTGTNMGAPTEDMDGNVRPLDGDEDGIATTDIGALEYS